MPILSKAPEDFNQCKICQHLNQTSTASDGCAERTQAFVSVATPLLDLVIGGPFKEYTLHNRDHAKKLVHLADYIIAPDTLSHLSPLECQAIVYSAFLHDLGMSLTSKERTRILQSAEYIDEFREWQALWNAMQQARKRLDDLSSSKSVKEVLEADRLLIETEIFQIQEISISAYLRQRHAIPQRYKELIAILKRNSNRPDLFEVNGVSFEDWLIDINVSHNQDVGVLALINGPHEERFPRDLSIGGQRLNTQFVAAVLRITDILDFDRERTPKVLFESLDIASRSLPGAEVSLKEWQKHMAIHDIEITDDEIIVSADCRHPAIEKTIKEFCQIIERDVRDTLTVLSLNTPQIVEQYQFQLPILVRPRIKSHGYIYKDISLQLNQAAITSLLMGERLYSNPAVAIRELIQNSIDACNARHKIQPEIAYTPNISVTLTEDDEHRHWIQVIDNGIGMDEHVLAEYFLKLGNTYYNSPEFLRLYQKTGVSQPFRSIARFGIGLIAVFMVADVLEVITRHSCSPRQDNKSRLVRIERRGGLAFVSELETGDCGTCVRIRLSPEIDKDHMSFAIQAAGYLKNIVANPQFDITVQLTDELFVLSRSVGLSLRHNAKDYLQEKHIEAIVIDLQRWSDNLSGNVVLFFAVNEDGKLSNLLNGRRLRIGQGDSPGIFDPNRVFDRYRGNRIIVDGFRMLLKKMSRIFKLGTNKIAAVLDCEIFGDPDVVYDVSRDRIIGQGARHTRNSIRSAIFQALSEMGTLACFNEETYDLVNNVIGTPESASPIYGTYIDSNLDRELLDKVAKLLPKGRWPHYIHKEIALKLDISHTLANRLITVLINSGAVQKP